jgi:2-haloacid dehalogenase
MIDWESGIFSALRPVLHAHKETIPNPAILELYSELELEAERRDFLPYRQVLRSVVVGFGYRLGFVPSEDEIDSLPNSVADWNPFPDTVDALSRMKSKYQLAVISNVDDDLFANSAQKLKVPFDHVITAGQAGCYKPDLRIFRLALEKAGVPAEKVLHIGQSIYHDVLPAQSLGISTVWVNRPSPRPNAGAAKAAKGKPDLEVPNLQTLAAFLTA